MLGNSLTVDLLVFLLLKSFKIKAGQYPVVFKSHFLSLNLEEKIMDPILPSVILAQIPSVIRQLPGHKPNQAVLGNMFLRQKWKTHSVRKEQSKIPCSSLEWLQHNKTQGNWNINREWYLWYKIRINAYWMTSSQWRKTRQGKHVVPKQPTWKSSLSIRESMWKHPMPKDTQTQSTVQRKAHQPSKAEFSVSKSGMLVILMKVSYLPCHLHKCTEKTKSGYNYLPFLWGARKCLQMENHFSELPTQGTEAKDT